ncbi:MAG: shikimate kinase [Clostridia bacterium]|nr:shikimate kinase [Clostridia bacterium]
MKNIILIGMPGTGKSTVGVLLAKSLLMSFTDTDLIIQQKYNTSLQNILREKGTEAFLEIEDNVLSHINVENSVIATGGSAVYGERAMANLKADGVAVYLDTPLDELEKRLLNIHTRGVAMKEGTSLRELFEEREPLYKRYADITVRCENKTAEECVEKIIEALKS